MADIALKTVRSDRGGISLEWSVRGILPDEMARRIPTAGSLALNTTALEAVEVVREELPKNFTRRAPTNEFFRQSFQVTKYSRRNDLEIAFGTSQALLQGRSASLLDHEDGTDRIAKGRNDFPYIPAFGNTLRATKEDLLPRWAYPKALGLVDSNYTANGKEFGVDRTRSRKGSKRGLRAKENRKGFILRDKQGNPIGIFRRVPLAGARVSAFREGGKRLSKAKLRRRGTGQSTLEVLFWTPKVVKIAPRLGFRRLADHTMEERIGDNFQGILAYLMNDNRDGRYAALSASGRDQIDRYMNPRRR